MRLPKNYTITLRLSSSASDLPDTGKPLSSRKRKRRAANAPRMTPPTSDLDDHCETNGSDDDVSMAGTEETERRIAEEEETRRTNAYPGATNSIGSVHQRGWYTSLDRLGSGFVRESSGGGVNGRTTRWAQRRVDSGVNGEEQFSGFEPFYVRGRDVERSVVTGRTAAEVMRDEGVEGYVSRKGWRGKV